MAFWLRIALSLLRSFLGPRRKLLDSCSLELRVWPHESEVSFANQAIYAHYLELGRWAWGMQTGALSQMFRLRLLTILGGQVLRYRRPLRRFQKFTVRTRMVAWDDKWIYLDQSLWVGSELAHSAIVKFCCKSRRGVESPESLLRAVDPGLGAAPVLPDTVRSWQELEDGLRSQTLDII